MADLYAEDGHDWARAENEFHEALARDSSNVYARSRYAMLLAGRGRTAESVEQLTEALRSAPLSTTVKGYLAMSLHYSARDDEALELFQQLRGVDASFESALVGQCRVFVVVGKFQEALTACRQLLARRNGRDAFAQAQIAAALGRLGRAAEASKQLTQLRAQYDAATEAERPNLAFFLATAYAGLDQPDQVFPWLEVAARGKSSRLAYLRVDPRFAAARADPRWSQVLAAYEKSLSTHVRAVTSTRQRRRARPQGDCSMPKKPKVSLRPVVDAIEKLLKDLERADEPTDAKDQHRAKALKATLEGTAMLLQSECFSRRRQRHGLRVPVLTAVSVAADKARRRVRRAPHVFCTWQGRRPIRAVAPAGRRRAGLAARHGGARSARLRGRTSICWRARSICRRRRSTSCSKGLVGARPDRDRGQIMPPADPDVPRPGPGAMVTGGTPVSPGHTRRRASRVVIAADTAARHAAAAGRTSASRHHRHPRCPHHGSLAHRCGTALRDRRTHRRFARGNIPLEAVWHPARPHLRRAGVGPRGAKGRLALKTSPSGGARHSLEAYVWVRRVEQVPPGLYHYRAGDHVAHEAGRSPASPTP